jgi:hypothetical protein
MSQFVPKFSGKQVKGMLILENPVQFSSFLRTFGDNKIDIVVRKIKKERSGNQNRYYFSVVVGLIAEHTGMDPMDTHDVLKQMFLNRVVYMPVKDRLREVVISGSTSLLKTDEFEQYLERIRRWASAELSIVIPDPNKTEVI